MPSPESLKLPVSGGCVTMDLSSGRAVRSAQRIDCRLRTAQRWRGFERLLPRLGRRHQLRVAAQAPDDLQAKRHAVFVSAAAHCCHSVLQRFKHTDRLNEKRLIRSFSAKHTGLTFHHPGA